MLKGVNVVALLSIASKKHGGYGRSLPSTLGGDDPPAHS